MPASSSQDTMFAMAALMLLLLVSSNMGLTSARKPIPSGVDSWSVVNAKTGEVTIPRTTGGTSTGNNAGTRNQPAKAAKFFLSTAETKWTRDTADSKAEQFIEALKNNAANLGIASPDQLTAKCSGFADNNIATIRFDSGEAENVITDAMALLRSDFPEILTASVCRPSVCFNQLARGILQSGELKASDAYPPEGSPFVWPQNLLGQDQIVAMADTGIDMRHCFFEQESQDPRQEFDGFLGPENLIPLVNKQFRKVVQYVTFGDDLDIDGHGTHVAGTIAGELPIEDRASTAANNGALNSVYSGMAPQAKLAVFDIHSIYDGDFLSTPEDLRDMYAYAYSAGARIHSNSWGYGNDGPDPINYYTVESLQTDDFMYSHRDFLILYAGGNDGSCGRNATIAPPATAKNIVSVGATLNSYIGEGLEDYVEENERDTIAFFSAQGPTEDGRIKPEVVAPGFWVRSAASNSFDDCSLTYLAGTSMATPATAGIVALIRQYFTDGFYPSGEATPADVFIPSGSLMKAVLMAGAQPMNFRQLDFESYSQEAFEEKCPEHGLEPAVSSKPDWQQGWGRAQLDKSIFFEPNKILIPSYTAGAPADVFYDAEMGEDEVDHMYEMCVRNTLLEGAADNRLTIMLVWTDVPDSYLVNDLHLKVMVDHEPNVWHLGNGGDSFDTVNPAESVRLELNNEYEAISVYVDVVNGGLGLGPTQPYSLVSIVDGEQITIHEGGC